MRVLRESGVTTLEIGLEAAMARSPCLANMMCKHGAQGKMAEGSGLSIAITTFSEFLKAVRDSEEAETTQTRSIDSVMSAVDVGSALGRAACDNLYTCAEAVQPMARLSGAVSIE
jgi:hypothetical protein